MSTAVEAVPAMRTRRWSPVVLLAIGALILVFGIIIWDPDYWRWGMLGVALYSVPLLCCVFGSTMIRVWGLWFGIFLVVQAVLSVTLPLMPNDYVTLAPNMRLRIDVEADNIPGISGIQNITTDEQGYRVTPPVDYTSADAVRIFAIGGSTTESILVDDKSTWTYLLQQGLSNSLGKTIQVVNTGVSGLRARNHLATLLHVRNLHPSAAIILVGANDWGRALRMNFATLPLWFEGMRLRRTLLGLAILRLTPDKGDPRHQSSGSDAVSVEHGNGYRRWQHSLDRPDKRRFTPDAVSADYLDYLERIGNVCDEQKLTCIFVTQPAAYSPRASAEVRATFWNTPPFASFTVPIEDMGHLEALYNAYLIKFAKERGHPVCDLAAQLSPTFDNFYDGIHYNVSGSRNVAQKLLPCVSAAMSGAKGSYQSTSYPKSPRMN
jgi:hypothetical protein